MLETEARGTVTVVRINRGRVNAIDIELLSALRTVLAELRDGPARAVVLTGHGSVFSSGIDLFKVLDGGAEYLHRLWKSIDQAVRDLVLFPKPMVAAVNGHAIAGGCVLVQACDYRIMAQGRGRIGVPELLVGVPFPRMALEAVRAAVPAPAFRQAVFLGRNYLPDEALAIGLLDETVDAPGLLDQSLRTAQRLAMIPTAAFTSVKLAAAAPMIRLFEERDDSVVHDALDDPETMAAVQEFVAKTLSKREKPS